MLNSSEFDDKKIDKKLVMYGPITNFESAIAFSSARIN